MPVLGFLALTGLLAWHNLTHVPRVTVPEPRMPVPNAFDTLVLAGKRVQEHREINNLYHLLQKRALTGVPQDRDTNNLRASLVAKNAAALELMRQSFGKEYLHPPVRSWDTMFPYLVSFRDLAQLCVLEAQEYAARGAWARSLDSCLDAVELGATIPRGGVLITHLVGISCESLGRAAAWQAVDHLSAEEARRAVARLERVLARTVPIADTLQEEKWAGQAGTAHFFQDPFWRLKQNPLSQWTYPGDEASRLELDSIVTCLRLHFYSNERLMRRYTEFMDACIATARKPYIAQGAFPAIPQEPLVSALVPAPASVQFQFLNNQAQNTLLLTALALRAFKQERGAYPRELQELVPGYLSQVPADPFGAGSLVYRRVGESYRLYSIGPDRQDDGGRPMDKGNQTGSHPRYRYQVELNGKGDIVQGINTL
ncbi:MAG: hypothetical protein RMJ43_11980 [Chloroherpetonaceae bacterium]|nr:hypothetical protein [Chloroherpetonaceae bacterium]